jgi:O-antigen ligase
MRLAVVVPLIVAGLYLSIQWIMASEWGYRLAGVLTGMYDSSARKRGEMAWAGIQIFREHPFFGIGFDQFRVAAWRWGAVFGAYSHSTFIEILSCLGGTGIVLYVAILGRLFVEFHKARKKILGNQELALSAITLWLFLSFVFFNTFSVEYYSKALWPLMGVLAGYAQGIRNRPVQQDAMPDLPGSEEHTAPPTLQTSSARSRWKGGEA